MTLGTYAHLFNKTDAELAAVIEKVIG